VFIYDISPSPGREPADEIDSPISEGTVAAIEDRREPADEVDSPISEGTVEADEFLRSGPDVPQIFDSIG
jgi:hypothetical protein